MIVVGLNVVSSAIIEFQRMEFDSGSVPSYLDMSLDW